MSARALPGARRAFFPSPCIWKFQYFSRVSGGGAVSAHRFARVVVKCSPTDSLEKIDAFLVLGRHIFKTRFCTSKRLRFFFQRKKKLWPNYQASFKSDLDFKKVKGCLRYFGQTFLLPKMKTFRDTEASFQDMTMANSKSIFQILH